eukprot:Gb_36766 [translate_table: standard]
MQERTDHCACQPLRLQRYANTKAGIQTKSPRAEKTSERARVWIFLSGFCPTGLSNAGPFNTLFPWGSLQTFIQKRCKKPTISARQHVENRTRDLTLEKLMDRCYKKLKIILRVQEVVVNRRHEDLSVQLLAKWRYKVGLRRPAGMFLKKYPHIFEVYTHPVKQAPWCRLTKKALNLIEEEKKAIKENESCAIETLKKLLMMSTNGMLKLHSIRLVTREFGLPDDFKNLILLKHPEHFRLIEKENVQLVLRDSSLAVAQVEKWREKEYREKWVSEFETRYAFKLEYPTGFKIQKGFKDKMRNWQKLPYLSPYEDMGKVGIGSGGGVQRVQKRAVGILHEFLSLTVEKMVDVERLSHFRKAFKMELNIRDLILEHPGIFYLSTKGNTETVFLREAYFRGRLIESNPVYAVRRKLLDLIVLGSHNARDLMSEMVENALANLGHGKKEEQHCTGAEAAKSGEGLDDENDDSHPDDTSDYSEDDECEESHLNSDLSEADEDCKGPCESEEFEECKVRHDSENVENCNGETNML